MYQPREFDILCTHFYFITHLGPDLPYRIQEHSMVKIGADLVILGGAYDNNYIKYFQKLLLR